MTAFKNREPAEELNDDRAFDLLAAFMAVDRLLEPWPDLMARWNEVSAELYREVKKRTEGGR